MGVEPTIRPAKDRIAGFEGRGDHRTPFASASSIEEATRHAQGKGRRADGLMRLSLDSGAVGNERCGLVGTDKRGDKVIER